MKNLLKKFLLIFVVGILTQPCVENTCWGMDKFIIVKLENGYEFNENDITSFNPDKFWENSKYEPIKPYKPERIDDKKKIKHSSRGALAFVSGKDKKAYVKFFKNDFIAKGSEADMSNIPTEYEDCIKCKHNDSMSDTPRVHSEIAFLQELTKNTNPKEINDITFLTRYNKYKESNQIIILIRNSKYIPCYWGDDPGYICMNYIADFCEELKKKTGKKITCIVQYEKDPNTYTPKTSNIRKISNFFGKNAIIYCYE